MTGHLQADLSLVVKPPGHHAVDLTEEIDEGQLGEKDDTLLVVAPAYCTVFDLYAKNEKTRITAKV